MGKDKFAIIAMSNGDKYFINKLDYKALTNLLLNGKQTKYISVFCGGKQVVLSINKISSVSVLEQDNGERR